MEDFIFSGNILVARFVEQTNFIVFRGTILVIFVLLDLEGRGGISTTKEEINRTVSL